MEQGGVMLTHSQDRWLIWMDGVSGVKEYALEERWHFLRRALFRTSG